MIKSKASRRQFLQSAAALTAVAMLPNVLKATPSETDLYAGGEGFSFLFQGDSITDGARSRNNDWNHVMGHGYQYIIASKLWYEKPQKGFHFFNRGVSGNKVTDLQARWQKDALELKPDVLSILIGINDAAAFIGGNNAFSVDAYEKEYRQLLAETKAALPAVQLVLCEPFVLPVGKVADKWDDYKRDVQSRQTVVKALSNEHDAVFVSFQQAFDDALSKAPAAYWIWDGIHPMPAGHELMAREWLKQVGKKLKFIR